jgi:spore coat protein CotH
VGLAVWFFFPGSLRSKSIGSAAVQDLFAGTNVVRINIQIPREGMEVLRSTEFGDGQPRPRTRATILEGGTIYTNVEIRLKGWYGSFRRLDQKPSFTLHFGKSAPGQTFHGYRKISLNNSVQDPSFISERISRELFEAAGVPVPQSAHARVKLNGRDLGLYVLTEGFNQQFLSRYFRRPEGKLYESHNNHDIAEPLIVNGGDEPWDDSGLKSLAAAMREPNPTRRLARLERVLDLDRFLSFVAMEVITCHWDGYAMNRNNYRVFHDLDSGRMVFMPSGMDQMFGTGRVGPRTPILPEWDGALVRAILQSPEGRGRYLARLAQLNETVFRGDAVLKRVDELAAVVNPVIVEIGRLAALRHVFEVQRLKGRIADRQDSLEQQLSAR